MTVVAVRAVISYAEITLPVASRNSIDVPSTSNGTAPDSVTTLPFTAVTVPLPTVTMEVERLVARPRLSTTSSSVTFAPLASICRR